MNKKTWFAYEGFDGEIKGVFCYDCAPSIRENMFPIKAESLEHYKVCPKCGRTVSETFNTDNNQFLNTLRYSTNTKPNTN